MDLKIDQGSEVEGRGIGTGVTRRGKLLGYKDDGEVAVVMVHEGFTCGLDSATLRLIHGTATAPKSTRERVLDEAKKLVTGDRNRTYGSPVQNFKNTADLWTVQFRHKLKDGEEFTAADVARAMAHLKLARMIAGDKEDNWTDLIGYGACGAECDDHEKHT